MSSDHASISVLGIFQEMVKATILSDAPKFNTLSALNTYYTGFDTTSGITAREWCHDLKGSDAKKYLLNVVRQMPPANDGGRCRQAAIFWAATWLERASLSDQDVSGIEF